MEKFGVGLAFGFSVAEILESHNVEGNFCFGLITKRAPQESIHAMDLATALHGGRMKSLGFASGETAVVPRTWDRGVVGCPTSRTETSKLTARAYLPHTSSHTTGDYHAVLGVSRFATKQEIKQSYRRLVLELHPDVCTGDHCSTRFLQVQRAYEVPTPPNVFKTFSQVSFTCFQVVYGSKNSSPIFNL